MARGRSSRRALSTTSHGSSATAASGIIRWSSPSVPTSPRRLRHLVSRVISAIAGLATILLAGLAAYLIREIPQRTSHEIALADERDKLHAASDRLKADIALRKEIEQKLREIQATLRDAVDSISEGFVIYDRDNCFVMCNEPYRRLYPKAARLMVPGTPFAEIVWASLDAGWYPDAVGCEPEWLADRMRAFNRPSGGLEQRLPPRRHVVISLWGQEKR